MFEDMNKAIIDYAVMKQKCTSEETPLDDC
jgi:hypothetical protein